MSRLRDLRLREEYRSDRSDLVAELFEPCLRVATTYDRAVVYFTSKGLAAAARGLAEFVDHNGQMRLVASPFVLMRAAYDSPRLLGLPDASRFDVPRLNLPDSARQAGCWAIAP